MFGFKNKSSGISYFDQCGEFYETWDDYLTKNGLPKCMMCYPTKGYYGNWDQRDPNPTEYAFCESPACTVWNQTKSAAKTAFSYTAAAMPILGIVFPPLAAYAGLMRAIGAFQKSMIQDSIFLRFLVQMGIGVVNFAIALGK